MVMSKSEDELVELIRTTYDRLLDLPTEQKDSYAHLYELSVRRDAALRAVRVQPKVPNRDGPSECEYADPNGPTWKEVVQLVITPNT